VQARIKLNPSSPALSVSVCLSVCLSVSLSLSLCLCLTQAHIRYALFGLRLHVVIEVINCPKSVDRNQDNIEPGHVIGFCLTRIISLHPLYRDPDGRFNSFLIPRRITE
jgi:hypothetical protein